MREAPRSTVWLVPTTRGRCFCKVDRYAATGEGALVTRLAELAPESVAEVLAYEPASRRLLSGDRGDRCLDDRPESDWLTSVRALATLQRATAEQLEDWIALGVPDWRGEALVARIDALPADEWMLRPGEPGGLDPAHHEHILRRRDEDVARVRRLAGSPIPDALVHQDVVGENVLWADGSPCFIDSSDAVVAHPFHACDRLLDANWSDRAWRERVIAAYLSPFEDLMPPAELRARFGDVLGMRVLYEGLRRHQEVDVFGRDHPQSLKLRRDVIAGLTGVAEFELRRAEGSASQ